MRVLSIGNFGRGWDNSICDEEHIAGALEELGHEVYRWDRQDIANDINNIKGGFDFVLTAQYDGYPVDLIPHLIKRYTDAPVVYWAFDHQVWGQEWHERLVKESDLYLSKRIADSKYPNWGWLSQDFAPKFLDRLPIASASKDIDVLFTGSYLPWAEERNKLLKVVDDKFNLVIHSVTPDAWRDEGFKNVNGPVMDDALPGLIARAKINISIDHTIEAGYWSDRNAQIMCCGGFVLFYYVPLSEQAFGTNVSYFSTEYGMIDGINYFLQCDEDRESLAESGYHFAQENLKVINRVMQMLIIVKERCEL